MAALDLREGDAPVTNDKPKTYNGDLAHLPAALMPLTQQPRWVVWPWEWRATKTSGRWTKPPRLARDPRHSAKSNDPSTWDTWETAVKAVTAGNADGIGFMLLGSDIGAGDLDHCRNPETGAVDPWAEALSVEANGAYREVTVSGGGLRVIGKVSGPEAHRKFTFDRNTGAGVEVYRNTARYITVSGLELGTCLELPPLDGFIDTMLMRYGGLQAGGLDFNDAGPQSSSINYDNLIRNGAPEGQRSDLFQSVVWHLAGKGWSADQIVDELARYPNGIAAKFADRLHAEVTRSFEKWRVRKRAASGGTASEDTPWPQIYVVPGELPRVVNEAETALLALGRQIYQRGGLIVRPVLSKLKAADDRDTKCWNLVPVTRPHLTETLTRAAQFLKWDARAKGFVPTNAPDRVAETYLARQGEWKLPILSGVGNAPFLRTDGSICERPGYDATSGILFKPDGQDFQPIPQHPSREDALTALALIDDLISTFPFVAPADRSVALSAILTALDRRAMATAPLHAFTAPAPGSGKSLLVDLAATLATGQLAPVIAQGRSEEELEKRLGAALLAGDAVISIDNCEYPLSGSLLCQTLTQQRLNIRLLGQSRHVEVPVNAAIFATGNNLTIVGDLTRRVLLCSIDPHCERPELRQFEVDVIQAIQADRGRLVVAGLTALRAWHVTGDRVGTPPFGSFGDWSRRVRAPLLWLGRTDPCDTMLKIREKDPKRTSLNTVLIQWKDRIGIGQPRTVQQVINEAVNAPGFHAALLGVAAGGYSGSGNMVSSDRLGRWLRKVEGQIVYGLTLSHTGIKDGYPVWCLIAQSGA
jgi:hypothetical protein